MKKPEAVRRGYLHMLLHCLYLHLFREDQEGRRLWNLACDIAVEQIISREKLPVLETGGDAKKIREKIFIFWETGRFRRKDLPEAEGTGFRFSWKNWRKPFILMTTPCGTPAQEKKEKEQRKNGTDFFPILPQTARITGNDGEARKGDQREDAGPIRSGNTIPKNFSASFPYCGRKWNWIRRVLIIFFIITGLGFYGDLPLIEPLEYKEVNRLEELVIAIDTSGSCDRETVRRFLGETYSILSEKENFFHKMKVYLIQCDCCIQDVKVIHSEEEWKEYSKNITIQGRGGTDFRPVFRYVKEQQEKKEIRSLKALIYFTDGDRIYPGSKPDYETAFVFLHKTEKMELVPPWAIRLVAEQEGVRHNI